MKKIFFLITLFISTYNLTSLAMLASMPRFTMPRVVGASLAIGTLGTGVGVYKASNATTEDIDKAICRRQLIRARVMLKSRQLIKNDTCPTSKLIFLNSYTDEKSRVWDSILNGIACADLPGYVPLLTDRNDIDGLQMLLEDAVSHRRENTVDAILKTNMVSATLRRYHDSDSAIEKSKKQNPNHKITQLLQDYIIKNPDLNKPATPNNNESSAPQESSIIGIKPEDEGAVRAFLHAKKKSGGPETAHE